LYILEISDFILIKIKLNLIAILKKHIRFVKYLFLPQALIHLCIKVIE